MSLSNIETFSDIPDDYTEVYNFYYNEKPKIFNDYLHSTTDLNHDIKNSIYFETYGGGPQGGILLSPKKNLYKVHREWGTIFNITKINGVLDIIKSDCDVLYIKIS